MRFQFGLSVVAMVVALASGAGVRSELTQKMALETAAEGMVTAGGCIGFTELYNPECNQCNSDGCGWFKCSAFTTWNPCKEGWKHCGSDTCVGGLCSPRRICGRPPA
jgi:hypothetical protein